MVQLVTAIVKPFMLEDVKTALRSFGVQGITVSEVQGYGRQGGKTETFRGSEYTLQFVPKIKIEVLVEATGVENVLKTVIPRNTDIRDAHFNKQDIFAYSPRSSSADAYRKLIEEVFA